MKTFAFLVLLTAFSAMTNFAQAPFPLEAGVSQKMAQWRAAHYSDVRYKLNITLEKGAPLMKGTIEIRVNLTEEGAKNDLVLDWRTTQFASDKDKPFTNVVAVNSTGAQASSLAVSSQDDKNEVRADALNAGGTLALQSFEHLIIPKGLLKTGENVFKINFASPIKTSGAAVTRYVDREDGAEYIYSLFVPSDASTAFPVFDQPDLKAKFQLKVIAPPNWKIISNTDGRNSLLIDSSDGQMVYSGQNVTEFAETKPISTYVFAFAAGDFLELEEGDVQTEEDKKDGLIADGSFTFLSKDPLPPRDYSKIYLRKSQFEKFKSHGKEVFRLNREGVKFLAEYFDFKFPFPKYDLVLIPEFPFRGMEHAGATFLREDSIIFPSEPTANDSLSRANVIFHEAAHQWFGDTVTMKWFDDLWLKEGFAEFMAYKTLEKVMPEYNAWKAFYERNKPLAYATDSTRGTTPIYQEIPNLSAAKSAYGNIVYRKAPSFLRQAEFYLGEDKFQTAVRAFLKKHQFKNAEWTDLVKEFETASNKDLNGTDLTNAWIKQGGLWKIEIFEGVITNQKNEFYLRARTKHTLNSDSERFMKFKVLIIQENGNRIVKDFELLPRRSSFKGDIYLSKKSAFVFPNYQDYGYGIFLLDEKSRDYVLKNIQNEKDDFLRSMMWGALWDSVREAEMDPKDYVELAVKNISIEKDELTISAILSRVSTAMNYYLSDAQVKELAPRLEELLIDKMQNAPAPGRRITFYRAFLNMASTEKARAVLKELLKPGTGVLPAFQLRTKDKFDIVTKLSVLGDADAPKLLADLTKTETSDEAKRYAYAVGAGFVTAKEKYFNDFLNNREISESWIESAFVPFNSPRHSQLTLPYLKKALAELPNLKRNRKIFFVNGWLAAFIGGQKDEKALAVVNKFLAESANLDKDLRLKILENLDVIERAVKIRAKYSK